MKKQLPVSLTRFEMYAGWFYWAFQLLILPVALPMLTGALELSLESPQLNFIFYCVNFAAATVLLRKFFLASCKQGLLRPWYTLQSACLGFGIEQICAFLFAVAIHFLLPDFINLNNNTVAGMVRENYGLMAVGTVFLVPVVEELLYRGVIFGCLYHRSRVAAYIVSTLIFSLVHLLGYISQYDPLSLVLSFLQYLPAGLCLGWAYARSGSILAPILIHMAVNQLGLLSVR